MIRPVTHADAKGLAELLHTIEALSQIAKESVEETLARVQKHLARIISSDEHTLLVAEESSRIVGYINVHWHPTFLQADGEGYVSELFVRPEFRSRNIGTLLTEKIIEEGKARACARLCLLNMRNKPSYERAYYSKHGWQERPNAANFIYDLKGNTEGTLRSNFVLRYTHPRETKTISHKGLAFCGGANEKNTDDR
jgi:ribosomal protein S18 acetylase RimI-like enzyme